MDFDKLNKQQLAAATYEGKNLLVLAGAGTGKTRTIIARAIYLVKKGVNPSRIKILSFTKKSAQEIVNRIKIEGSNIPETKQISGSTFHSWCMELIKRYGKVLGLEGFSVIDEEDRESAIKIAIGTVYNKKQLKIDSYDINASMISEIYSYAINTGNNLSNSIRKKIFPLRAQENSNKLIQEVKEHIVPIIKSYIEYKYSHHYLDYDDILKSISELLSKDTNIRKLITSLYDHILIDEMQDTNPLQWKLIDSFANNCNLFCVGDDAQSIYGFRGADFNSIHSFTDRIPNSEVYKLEENYRSTQEILDLSNWILNESSLIYNKQLYANRGNGDKPIMQYVYNEWEEAEFITDNILLNTTENKCFKDHMILSRNIFSLRKIEATCISKKIPYIIFGGVTLMKSAHVRDIISALRILVNFRDELAWMRYLTLWKGIGEITASKIIKEIMNCNSYNHSIEIIKSANLLEDNCYSLLESIRDLEGNPVKAIDTSVSILENTMQKKYENWDMRKLDFNALKAVAKQTKDISSFINEYILDPIAEQSILIDDINKKSDHITISTIHSAKGLESSICYITNVRPGIYPFYKCTNSFEEIEEERRCLYVALTRAKDTLYLISSIQSNSSINNENEEKKHIVDTYNLNNTGIILEYISTYDNIKETESTTIAYRLDTNPKEILYMDESDFLDRFIITENNQQHYFFNNLPENLVEFKSTNNKLSLEVYSSIHKSTRYNPLGDFDFS